MEAGTRLGRYEIRSKLGAGGMGEVYQGRDTQLGRDVAVKVLPTTVSTDADRLRRFKQEACAASALNHPNILIVHDIGAHDGTTYVVSELLEGETLSKRIAGLSNQAGISNVWLYEVARGVKTPFTFGPEQTRAQVWSPDGGSIVFTSNRKGHLDLYRKAASGAGSEQLLMESNLSKIPTSFSPDGRFLLYNVTDPKTKVDVWVLPLDGSQKPLPFLQGGFNENNAQFSPDGRWIAYQSDESNRNEIYVTPFPGASGKRQISISGGRLPKWRRNELFYLSLDNKLMVSEVIVRGDTLEVGAAQPLFEIRPGGPGNTYDVTADGQRFLVNTAVEQQITLPITLVLNWTADLKK